MSWLDSLLYGAIVTLAILVVVPLGLLINEWVAFLLMVLLLTLVFKYPPPGWLER